MQSYVYAVAVDANGSTTECVLYALYCNVKHQWSGWIEAAKLLGLHGLIIFLQTKKQ